MGQGHQLRALQTIRPGTGNPGAPRIVADSVVVRQGDQCWWPRGLPARPVWGSLGVGPSGKVTTKDEVTVDYRYSLLRLDFGHPSARRPEIVREGTAQLTVPEPPPLNPARCGANLSSTTTPMGRAPWSGP